ncbi:tryptophan-rich antigen [Plasmodium knowlesi strain H]|uniref:Tryptophan-rich antigen n=3 Tax=Plasmodium knowlesi TaxID=5850 RepID=A0A5K1VH72_PLAKH|nr:tryptophan-rich antigen [Plasmodium knowlesi strain H]OTN66170.1 Tryptophan-rich antigen [Plasmodium knowlesi]CAA9989805.1 tryptophan-rich antigen [Plasmodium knowlesi strain H]SBO24347.1 tryptophan-rich antigen [Plasmodium knowlesi strain H]SBO26700.1 tryptophan-rich antigen [Plasmodium knowlesi strain H]VVS79279.1 tryptophan-rich antigen [Plasmodium knowlesi strain H]|eukprot:XP_002259819.1 hypothetical protein, conserved in Plasmodium species [Plasmodium knowlesi strain H]
MESNVLKNGKFAALNLAAPIINEGMNVGKRLIEKLTIPTVADIILTITFFALYKLYNDFKKMKFLQPRENHQIIYDAFGVLEGNLTTEEKIQRQLMKIENHNRRIKKLQDWFKDVEKRVKAERKKIDLATGRAKSDDLIGRAKHTAQYVINPEQEITLDDKEEKEIMENGVKKIQNGLQIIEELIQKIDDGTGKIPKDNLGSYRQEIEIPEDKMAEFDEGLELFEEGLKIIQDRVQNNAGESEIEEIKIELEEHSDEEEDRNNSSFYLYSRDANVQEPCLSSKLETYRGKMAEVEKWINQVDETMKNEAKKIREGVEAEVKAPESYAQDAGKTTTVQVENNTMKEETHDNEYQQGQTMEEEPTGELTEEWKVNEWKKWMNNTENDWEKFMQSFERHKQMWIQEKENEWEEWLTNIHYNWLGFTTKLEGDYISDKTKYWKKWDENEWKGIIEMEWTRPMKVKWAKLVEKNEKIWGDKFFNYWDNWKDKKWNEWKNKNWKKKEEEQWNNFEEGKDLNNDENWKEWNERLLREKQEWKNWVNEKEDSLMDAEETHWKKWKEYKWNYLNEWMKQVKVKWLKAKPWEVWKQAGSDIYESNIKVKDDVQHSEREDSLSS